VNCHACTVAHDILVLFLPGSSSAQASADEFDDTIKVGDITMRPEMIRSSDRSDRRYIEDLIPLGRLAELAKFREAYESAVPYPHIVIDDFLEEQVLNRLIDDFPGPQDHEWLRYKARFENDKLQSTSELSMPHSVRDVLAALNSSTFVRFLEQLTGISGVVPDPHLYGGGMHQILTGGHLGVHVDYNRHEQWQLDRRLNALLYLNRNWREEWGGALELWNKDVTVCKKRIFPIANRLVIFSTTEHAWHGHPAALACPPDVTRKSLALYYYTNGRPDHETVLSHGTIFRGVEGEARPFAARELVRDLLPPIVARAARAIFRR
jgi:Rps23 Pro-64 3,4-dihydroxylase Tpa1-like proline 4-hydroxylase